MKDKLGKTKEEVKNIVREMTKYAKEKCNDIEFSLEDATRTDKNFSCEIIDIAIQNGATTINIPDTVGYTIPSEFFELITYIKNHSKYINTVDLSVHCHNDLGLATANSLSAIEAGANQIECTINGIGERAGNAALEEIVAVLQLRKETYQRITTVETTKINELSLLVQNITKSYVQNNKPIVGKNAFRHEAGIHQAGVLKNKETYEILKPEDYGVVVDSIVLGIHSGKNAMIEKIEQLGHRSSHYDVVKIVEQVKEYFNMNKTINDTDFESIIKQNRVKSENYPKINVKTNE